MSTMKRCSFDLEGISPISFSKAITSIKDSGEGHDAFEERTWRERMHRDEDGYVFIPPMALKNCIAECAKYLSESVPGKGKSKYTKHFEAGTLAIDPLPVLVNGKPIHFENVEGERLFVPSDGKKGGAQRVYKTFPYIPQWTTQGSIILLDPLLVDKTEKVEEYVKFAGQFIGLGRFRPRNGGYYGRYKHLSFEVEDIEM